MFDFASTFQGIFKEYYFVFIIIFITILIVIIGYYFSPRKRILRKLKQTDKKRIQLIKDHEYAKIIGKAIAIDKPLISPIGKRKCVYYQIKVEEKRGGKNRSWHTIIKEDKGIDFIIEADGEKAVILANTNSTLKTRMVHLVKDVKHTSGTWNDPSKHLEAYLQSHGKDSTGLFGFNKSIRYHEGIIAVGEKITVLGTSNWKESDQNFDRYSSKNLYLSGDNENKLLITDDPKAQELKK